MTKSVRWLRGHGVTASPLRRRTDRVEGATVIGLLLLALSALPLAISVGSAAYHARRAHHTATTAAPTPPPADHAGWSDTRAAEPAAAHRDADALTLGVGAALLLWTLTLALLRACYAGLRSALDRRREAAWQREWRSVEPIWRQRLDW